IRDGHVTGVQTCALPILAAATSSKPMKPRWALLLLASLLAFLRAESQAGAISYVAIPATQSDTNCGISRNHGYTTAVDGGNTRRSEERRVGKEGRAARVR